MFAISEPSAFQRPMIPHVNDYILEQELIDETFCAESYGRVDHDSDGFDVDEHFFAADAAGRKGRGRSQPGNRQHGMQAGNRQGNQHGKSR